MTQKNPSRRSVLTAGAVTAIGVAASGQPVAAQSVAAAARAYRAEWYDVADDKRAGFISWLHGSYLPRLKQTEGVVWVGHYQIASKSNEPGGSRRSQTNDPNVPKGSQYVLLTAGQSIETFLAWQSPVSLLQTSAEKELAVREGYREAVFIEEIHVAGPGGAVGPEPPPAMQLGNYNVRSPNDERDLALHYRLQKLPEVSRTPGSLGARKLVSVIGWPKHGILYEFSDMNPDESLFEARMSAGRVPPPVKLRSTSEFVVHAPNAPHAGVRIWPEKV